ncbi:unnamed protein product [marine sediment metagenome]|uniref:Uncharacterized protein n=1 Tax=marine sediment metagenome TaxID=412755 RepID=X0YAN6_9ZZZZ
MGTRIVMHMFPFGAPYFFGLFGSTLLPCIRLAARSKQGVVLCIHPWQIFRPDKPAKFIANMLTQGPFALPYCLSRRSSLEKMLGIGNFVTMRELAEVRRESVAK